MSDRIIRDELWLSERFLDLPTDAARLAFLRFLSVCDDFGNFEGGPRRIYRMLCMCTQIKTEDASAAAIDALLACDLVRRYEVEGREFFHIPRFKSHRQYLSRAYPCSPWCDPNVVLGKTTKLITNKGLAKTLLPHSNGTAEGVGVGVGEKLVSAKKPRTPKAAKTHLSPDFEVSDGMYDWCKGIGLSEAQVMPETEKWADHHRSKGNQFVDWIACWRVWMRNAVKFAQQRA